MAETKAHLATLLLILLAPIVAQASGEPEAYLAFEYRRINPRVFNLFSSLDVSDSDSWSSYTGDGEFRKSFDVVASAKVPILKFFQTFYFGIYGRFIVPTTAEQKGVSATSDHTIIKKTTLSGYMVGGTGQIYLFKAFGGNVLVEGGMGFGLVNAKQQVNNGQSNALEAQALSLEQFINLAFEFKATDSLQIYLCGGYARHRSNVMTVKHHAGPLYSDLKNGDSLRIDNGSNRDDLTLDRSGAFVGLGVGFDL